MVMWGYVSVQVQATGGKDTEKLRSLAYVSVTGMNVKPPGIKKELGTKKNREMVLTVFVSESRGDTSGMRHDIKLGKQMLDLNKVTKRGASHGVLEFINFYWIQRRQKLGMFRVDYVI